MVSWMRDFDLFVDFINYWSSGPKDELRFCKGLDAFNQFMKGQRCRLLIEITNKKIMSAAVMVNTDAIVGRVL